MSDHPPAPAAAPSDAEVEALIKMAHGLGTFGNYGGEHSDRSDWLRVEKALRALQHDRQQHAAATAPAPVGWRLVPSQPTTEMLLAAMAEGDRWDELGTPAGAPSEDTWRVMLKAAPVMPAPIAELLAVEGRAAQLHAQDKSAKGEVAIRWDNIRVEVKERWRHIAQQQGAGGKTDGE